MLGATRWFQGTHRPQRAWRPQDSTKLICGSCNNATGSGIDKTITEHLAVIANNLDIRTGRNERAPTLKNVATTMGQRLDLLPGARPVISKAEVNETPMPGGKVRVNIRVPADEAHRAEDIMEGLRKKYGAKPEQIQELQNEKVFLNDPVELRFEVGGPEDLRAIAKMAFLLFCDATSGAGVAQGVFDEIREYIRSGAGTEQTLINHESRDLFDEATVPQKRRNGVCRDIECWCQRRRPLAPWWER